MGGGEGLHAGDEFGEVAEFAVEIGVEVGVEVVFEVEIELVIDVEVGIGGRIGGLGIGPLFSKPQVLVLTGALIGILGLIPGMPNVVFLLLALSLRSLAWGKRKKIAEEAASATAAQAIKPPIS